MIDLETIGYFLFMEEAEAKQKQQEEAQEQEEMREQRWSVLFVVAMRPARRGYVSRSTTTKRTARHNKSTPLFEKDKIFLYNSLTSSEKSIYLSSIRFLFLIGDCFRFQ